MPSSTRAADPPSDDRRLKRDMGLVGLLFASVGSIIGSGWLFGALSAAQLAGPASVLSWGIGAVMVAFIGLCYAELGTMFPVSGGVVRFPHYAFGSLASYTTGWITWLAVSSTAPIEVEAALQYATNYIPWLQRLDDNVPVLTGPGYAVAAGLMALFSLINVVGIRWFARLNNALVWWKLGIILVVIVAFLSSAFHPANFSHATAGGFLPFGWHGVFSLHCHGRHRVFLPRFPPRRGAGRGEQNPSRNVPIAVLGSIAICGVIYVALQVGFIGALPENALDNGWAHIGTSFSGGLDHVVAAYGPLAALATQLGLTWLALLLYIDAFVSPADTGLIYTTVTARISYAMGRNGNAPAALARVSKRGVPWVSVIVTFLVGLIYFLPFPGWQKLVGFVTSATVLSFGSGPLALVAMRGSLPEHSRPFRLPGGWTIPFLAFFSSNLIVYWSGWETNWKLFVAVLLGFVVFGIHEAVRRGQTPPKDYRAGFWVLPWLGGLALLSFVGSYPEPSKHAGNLGWMTFESSFPVLAVFSALIFWLAYALRLPPDRVDAHLNDRWEEPAGD